MQDRNASSDLYANLEEQERQQLDKLVKRLSRPGGEPVTAAAVGKVLPEAVSGRAPADNLLAESFVGPTVDAIGISVRRSPEELSNHLFPVIGDMIRKALVTYFRGLTESIDRSLEKGLTLERLRWRIRSRRTGVPYYEIVLAETLEYRAEQAFLIQKGSGILIAHVARPDLEVVDPDMVSAMLTAIRDFVNDSFRSKGDPEGLTGIDFGDKFLMVEEGPQAIIAVAVRGTPAKELRLAVRQCVELVHFRFAGRIAAFTGNTEEFADAVPLLRECLLSREKGKRHATPVYSIVLFSLIGAAILAFAGLAAVRGVEAGRVTDAIRRVPGVIVTRTERHGGQLAVYGLKDPLADDPLARLGRPRLLAVRTELEPFISFAPGITERRVRKALAPPDTVTFAVAGDRISFRGTASAGWIAGARAAGGLLGEVYVLDFSGVGDALPAEVSAARAAVASTWIVFTPESATMPQAGAADLRRVSRAMATLLDWYRKTGREVTFVITGYQYEKAAQGVDLRAARSEAVRRRLVALGIPAEALVVSAGRESAAGGNRPDRRVDFAVTVR